MGFNWRLPSTFRSEGNWHDPEAEAQQEHKWSVVKRSIVLGILLVGGLAAIFGINWWANYLCCVIVVVFPIWQVACVVSLLSVVSPTGTLGVVGSLAIGILAGLALGLSLGLFGVVFGVPAGLLGALLFKQFELNNML